MKNDNKRNLKENEFSPAPGGVGSLNYGQQYGTFSSPDVSQNSNHFALSQDPNHFESEDEETGENDKALGSKSNTAKVAPDLGDLKGDIDTIYSKKDVPSPDEVVAGIKYEMSQQIKRDKHLAKRIVLSNLKRDPHYYSNLKMLNIDDKDMMNNVTEIKKKHPNDSKRKLHIKLNKSFTTKILESLKEYKNKQYTTNPEISDIMKDMWNKKLNRRL